MSDENKWENLRQYPRIAWNFVVKFRARDGSSSEWQVSTIKDISEGGCCFHSNIPYSVGQALEIRIQFPSLRVPMEFIGEVRRCETGGSGQFALHSIGIYFLEMDVEKKKQFMDTIVFFLKKKQK